MKNIYCRNFCTTVCKIKLANFCPLTTTKSLAMLTNQTYRLPAQYCQIPWNSRLASNFLFLLRLLGRKFFFSFRKNFFFKFQLFLRRKFQFHFCPKIMVKFSVSEEQTWSSQAKAPIYWNIVILFLLFLERNVEITKKNIKEIWSKSCQTFVRNFGSTKYLIRSSTILQEIWKKFFSARKKLLRWIQQPKI